jgi:O-antigen/teichoic acid export membrane protein
VKTFLLVQIISICFSFILTLLLSKFLKLEDYGAYRYSITWMILCANIFNLGIPFSVSRLLARTNNENKKSNINIVAIASLIFTSIFSALVFYTYQTITKAKNFQDNEQMLITGFFICIPLGINYITNISQGSQKFSTLYKIKLLPFLLNIPLTIYLANNTNLYSLHLALLNYGITFLITFGFSASLKKPQLQSLKKYILMLFSENKKTGFPIYIGGVLTMSTSYLVILYTKNYANAIQYGEYAFAVTICSPVASLISGIGLYKYKQIATEPGFNKKLFKKCVKYSVTIYCLHLLFSYWVLLYILPQEYIQSYRYIVLLSLHYILIGLGDFLHKNLSARGYGRVLFKIALLMGIILWSLTYLTIDRFKIWGTIVSTLISSTFYFMCTWYYCNKKIQ